MLYCVQPFVGSIINYKVPMFKCQTRIVSTLAPCEQSSTCCAQRESLLLHDIIIICEKKEATFNLYPGYNMAHRTM